MEGKRDPGTHLIEDYVDLQSRSGRGGEEKNSSRCLESKPGCPARSSIAVLTQLPRL
jgi:hypothetical protein